MYTWIPYLFRLLVARRFYMSFVIKVTERNVARQLTWNCSSYWRPVFQLADTGDPSAVSSSPSISASKE